MAVTDQGEQGEHAGPVIDEEFINFMPREPREHVRVRRLRAILAVVVK
jgi:hypothetical protein